MEPRLKSSIKWVALPKEYCEIVHDIFESNYADKIVNAEIIVEGRIYREEIIVRLGYLPRGSIRQSNFEASIDFNIQKDSALDLLNFMMDPIANMFEAFLTVSEDTEFPKVWKKFTFKSKDVYLQYSAINSRLEEEADRILGLDRGMLSADLSEDELKKLQEEKDWVDELEEDSSNQVH